MAMDELERREFEKWALHYAFEGAPGARLSLADLTRNGDNYTQTNVQVLWECWQAGYESGADAAW